MKVVEMVQTQDGVLHKDAQKAEAHAENLYGSALSAIAHKLAHIQKYSEWMDFIDQNLDSFVRLKALKDDIQMEVGEV